MGSRGGLQVFPKAFERSRRLVGAEREYAKLYRNAIVSAYIEGASAALKKAQRYYGGYR